MNTLSVIDGDSLCYLCSKETIEESISSIDNLLKEIFDKTGSTSYYLFLSEGKYFRHKVYPKYKGNRKYNSPLKYLKTLKSYLKEQYYAEAFEKVEADDMLAFVECAKSNGDLVLDNIDHVTFCSIDKDVINQVPGHHFNYKTQEFTTTSEEEAEYYLYLQTLMGDSADNITGIPGVGKVKANQILKEVEAYDAVTLLEYQDRFGTSQGIREFAKNFNLVYLLRTPNDFEDMVGYVPNLQKPIEIVS